MSISIRLAKFGKKNAPSYRIVVANTRDKRNGRFIDIVGHYNPSETPVKVSFDKKKIEEWQGKGALITAAVEKILSGKYEFTPYRPHSKEAAANATTETPQSQETAA